MDDETRNWLLLMRLPVTSNTPLLTLIDTYKSPSAILGADDRELRLAGFRDEFLHYLRSPDWQSIDQDLEWLNKEGHHFVPYPDQHYPVLLREIPEPPPALFVRGNLNALHTTQLGMVGSRNPSPAGKHNAGMFAGQMAQLGITVTSGLATGIDCCSHRGALDGDGITIAVLGNGIDQVYPQRHLELADQIADKGALITEFVTGTPPLARNFPRRNRIISGMSVGVLVVEAAPRSGSLITARHALDQGREVFAVPGSIHNPLAHGCHWLIKQGAKLVESHEDILEELKIFTRSAAGLHDDSATEKHNRLDSAHKQLLNYLGYDPVSIDRLVEFTGLTAPVVSSMLLTMEIEGVITSCAGGYYMKIV